MPEPRHKHVLGYLTGLRDQALDAAEQMIAEAGADPQLVDRSHVTNQLRNAEDAQRRLELLAKV